MARKLRYIDPATGHDVRRRLSGLSREEIKSIAQNLTVEAYQGRGYLAGKDKAPEISDGLAEAILLAGTQRTTEKERARHAKVFVDWLLQRHPNVKTWDQLKPAMIVEFIRHLEKRGLAYDSIRLGIAPVKLAWRSMAENYPDLVRPLPKIKLPQPPRREIDCLNVHEVDALLNWLKINAADIWPMACLQAYAGLRVYETAYLREQDVDLLLGAVKVTETNFHKPKTRNSYRTIPVCQEIIAALNAALISQEIRPASGEIFTTKSGSIWNKDNLVQRWRRTLQRAARDLDEPRYAQIPIRKLRASFITMAGQLDIPDRMLKAYVGHSSGDVMGEHYRRIELNELRQISSRIEQRKELLKEKAECFAWQHSGNISQNACR